MNTGSYNNIGPNQLVGCSDGVATWSAGRASVREGDLPAIQYHLASGASSISGTSNFTYQVGSVSAAEAGHTTNQSQCRDLGKLLYRSSRRRSRNIDRM
jgi:hypothetical protein